MATEDTGELARFRRELTRLKRDGAALLIVGDAVDAHRGFCHKSLVRASVTRRIFVNTDATYGYRPGQPIDRPRTTDVHVQFHAETRSATAAEPLTGDDPTTHAETLRDLGEAVSAAIDDASAAADQPAQLRLCVDSLLPLVDATDAERVFRLLHPLLADCRGAAVMAHVHLPVAHAASLAHLFRPLFDAVVELQLRDGLPSQRWHVDEVDVTTAWLPIMRG